MSATLTAADPIPQTTGGTIVAVKLPGVKRAYFEAVENAGAGHPAPGRWTGSPVHNWARVYGGDGRYLLVSSPGPLAMTGGRRFTIIGNPVWRAQDTYRNAAPDGQGIAAFFEGGGDYRDRQAGFLGHCVDGVPTAESLIAFLEKNFVWVGVEGALDAAAAAAALGLPDFEFPEQKQPSRPGLTAGDETAIRRANALDTALWEYFGEKGRRS